MTILLIGGCAMAAPSAEPTVDQAKEGYEHGVCSRVDVLTAQEDALLKEIIGKYELPKIKVEGDIPTMLLLQSLYEKGQLTEQEVQKAEDDWLRILQIGVVMRGLQPGEQVAALQKNLIEQQQIQQKLKEAGYGNPLALFMVNAKLSAWFPKK